MAQTLHIQVKSNQPIAILTLEGVLARLDVYKLKKEIEDAIGDSNRFLVVDLRGVTFIDSAGIGVLCQVRPELMRQGGRLVLIRPNHSDVIYSLESASIDKVFEFYDDVEAAYDALNHKFNLGLRSLNEFFGETETAAPVDPDALEQVNRRIDGIEKRFDSLEALLREQFGKKD